MAKTAVAEFLRKLRGLNNAAVDTIEAEMKVFKSEVGSLDVAINNMKVTKNSFNATTIGGEFPGAFHRIVSEGNLKRLIDMSNVKVAYNSADAKVFEAAVRDTPHFKTRVIRETAEEAAKHHPQLKLSEADFQRLSSTSQKSVATVECNLLKNFREGMKISLTLGVVVVGGQWLHNAIKEAKGCHMMTNINGIVTSCKFQAFSCIGSGGELCQTSPNTAYYNVTLVLIALTTRPDDDKLKYAVCLAADVHREDMHKRLAYIIDEKFDEVAKVIESTEPSQLPRISACELRHPDVENGEIPPCRMCTPSADPRSTQYINQNLYPDNVTFHCVTNPTALDIMPMQQKRPASIYSRE